MRFRGAVLATVCMCMTDAQTLVDLRTQTKSVDFSNATTTKPFKSGSVLPSTCSVGETFFNTNAPAGTNVYVCASLNSWTLAIGTTGPQGPAGAVGPSGPAGPAGPAGANGAIGRVQNGGVNLPVESILNFSAGGCTDDPTNGRTNCNPAGISGLNVAVNGSTQGTQPTLNLISGSGIVETCTNNAASNRVDCTPASDTSYLLSRDTDQAGDDKSLLPASANSTTYTYCPSHALAAYKQGQVFRFRPDVNSGVSPTLNICGLGPIALQKNASGTLTNITTNDLTAGTWYQITAVGSVVNAFEVTPTNFAGGAVTSVTGSNGVNCSPTAGAVGCSADTAFVLAQTAAQTMTPWQFVATSNSGDNYIGTMTPVCSAFTDSLTALFTPNVTNAGGPMTVDCGIGPKRVYKYNSTTDPTGGDFILGHHYVITYSTTLSAWELMSLPSGSVPLVNPMTTAGDLTYGGTSGTPTRLATGTGILRGGTPPTYSELSGDVVTSGSNAVTIAANAVSSSKMSVANTRRTCTMVMGADNAASALGNTDIAPQGQQCFIPYAATVVEVTVRADAGTPSVVVSKDHTGTQTDLLSSALATASAGAKACANTSGTAGLDGVTTCSNILSVTSLAAGDWIETHTATAGGTAKRMSIAVTYTVN